MSRGYGGGLVVVLVLASCGTVLKPAAPDRRLNIQQTGSVFEASNGYQLAVLPEPMSSVIRLDVRYPVGAADDPVGKEGLAHLVEHLLFDVEYSSGATKTSVSAELGRVALAWNAETHKDFTTYETLLAPENLTQVVGLEVNRLAIGCAGLTPQIFAREREVVLNELRQNQGASGAQVRRVIVEELYPAGHPYRAVDSVDTVAKLELKDACDFITTQYQRGKAIVLVSGHVTEHDVQVAASKQFIRLRKRNLVAKEPPPPVNPPPGTVHLKADIDEPGLFLATWSLPPQGTREYRLLETAWPMIEYRLEQFAFTFKWGHTSFTTTYGGAHAPVLAVGIYLNSLSDADEAKSSLEKSVRAAFEMLGHDSDDESWRLRMYGRAETLLARWESLGSRNEMFGDFLMFDTTQELIIGRVAELQKSSPGEVRTIGQHWLMPSQARYLVIEPSGTMPAQRGRTYTGGAEAHATTVDGALADQPLPPPPPQRHLGAEQYQLGNGLTVMLWPYGNTPIVRGTLIIDSGSAHEPKGDEGLASMIGGDVGPDSIEFTGRELSIYVDNLVVELGYELRAPGQPISDEAKSFLKGRLRKKRAAERQTYDTQMRAAVFGETHPYARPSMTEASVDRIHQDLVNEWARKHLVAKNATLIITGQFDAELVKKHIAYNVDQVRGGTDSNDISFGPPSSIPRFVTGITDKPSPTVELDLEFLSAPGLDDSYAKRLVLEEVLDAELSKLRNKHALTYGFYASYSPRKGGGLWRIGGDADASRADEAATSVLSILAEIRKDPDSYRGSFVLARQKVIERLLVAATDSASVAEQLAAIARFDLDDTFFDHLAAKVAKLTLQDFHLFLNGEIPARRQVFGAFGNPDAAKAAVDAAHAANAAAANAPSR